MHKEYWQDRWQNQQTGFHQDDINPYLEKFCPAHVTNKTERVFVPLCGKSSDLIWLADRGFEVIGVELSQIAVEEFFEDNNLPYVIKTTDKIKIYEADNISIICDDFFEVSRDLLGDISYVYDRASQIALPEAMRRDYCKHLAKITAGADIFVITMEYDQNLMQGPPFSVSEAEMHRHYDSYYTIDKLFTHDLLEESPQFKERGLKNLLEKVYILSPL